MKRYKNKKRKYIPTGIQRMDKELLSEVKMYYSITKSIEATAKAYHISIAMVEFAVKNGCDFDNLQKEIIKEEKEWWIIM